MEGAAAANATLELLRDAAALAGLDLLDALASENAAKSFCAKLKAKCSTGVNHPVNGGSFKAMQNRLPEISAAVLDPQSRAELSRLYGAEIAVAKRTQLERLNALLAHLKEAGKDFDDHTRASVLKEFVPSANSILTEADIDSAAAQAGLAKRSAPLQSSVSLLLATDIERLGASLKILSDYDRNSGARYVNLYQFLGITAEASEQELKTSIATLEKFWGTKGNGQAKTAAQEALSRSKIWLSGAERRRYDLTLMYSVLGDADLWTLVAVAGAGGVLDTVEFGDIRRRAIDAGASPEEAEALIQYEANRRSIRVAGTPPPAPAVKRCGYCGRSSSLTAKVCTNATCKRPFGLACIECGATYDSPEGICPKCGLTLSAQMQIEEAQARVSTALSRGDIDAARDAAALICSSHPQSKKARALAEWVKSAVADLELELAQVASLVGQRRLVEAARILEESASRRRLPPERQAELDSIKADIERAEKLAIGSPGASEAEAYGGLEAAYAICTDSPRIRSAAVRFRPDPPKMISADQRDGMVALRWAASPSTGVNAYRVFRRLDSAPVGTAGAEELACVGLPRFEDSTAPVGRRLYYGVVAERLGVPSTPLISSPVIRTAPVDALHVIAGDGWVRAKWTLPVGATGVTVKRKEHGSAADGVVVVTSKQGLTDSSVINGRQYCYSVQAEFSATDGVRRSVPVSFDAIPKAPPKPPTVVSATVEGMKVTVSYPADQASSVVVVRTQKPLAFSEGQLVSVDDLEAAGHVIRSAASGHATDLLEGGGVYYYTLAAVDVPQAAVGPTTRVVALQDCTGLKADVQDSNVSARWTWPIQSTVVVLTAALGRPAASFDEPATVCVKVGRPEYDRVGALAFAIPTSGDYHLRVFAGYETDGGITFAPGSSGGCTLAVHVGAKSVLAYTLLRGLLGGYQLKLTGPRGMCVPDCIVVSKPGFVPIGPNDGSTLTALPSFVLDTGSAQFSLPSPPKSQSLKLFFADPKSYETVQIVHPPADKLKVN